MERLGRETGVPWVNLRLFYLFGRYEPASRLLPHLVHNLARGRPVELSSGRQVRDYTDVDEAAGAYLRALRVEEAAARTVYHVGMMLVYETENRLAGRLDDLRDLVAELERAVAGSRTAA